MHQIQQFVIRQLMSNEQCRYRDIKPKDIEGNLFMYHLRRLMREGLVEKKENYYYLTRKGMRLVDTLSLKSMQPRIQPKIVTLLACKNTDGQWLLYRRAKQPFHGFVGFPYGKIHLGEKLQDAAERELEEKTGLSGELHHAGDVYLTVGDDESLISHMLFHVFTGVITEGELREETMIGQCFWSEIDDVDGSELMPGFLEIVELLKTPGHFFTEINRTVSSTSKSTLG